MKIARSLRLATAAFVLAAIGLALGTHGEAGFIQSQRSQRSVYILVNVTPAPIVYAPSSSSGDRGISVRMALRQRGGGSEAQLARDGDGVLVAAVPPPGAQNGVKVEAEVTPDPNATLLYADQPAVLFNAVAGTTVTQPCAYHVTVHTTITRWTLRDGLSNDFASGTFPGSSLSNNSYDTLNTPQPAATPFVVYPAQFVPMASAGGIHTYCVDLTLSIPASVPGGAYSTNAVYTLYY
ncbi:MAG TPA: hypothetical protein VIG32_08390 [Candidatus Baltobacteraceae bacterium]|jgi:hypothetical protein